MCAIIFYDCKITVNLVNKKLNISMKFKFIFKLSRGTTKALMYMKNV